MIAQILQRCGECSFRARLRVSPFSAKIVSSTAGLLQTERSHQPTISLSLSPHTHKHAQPTDILSLTKRNAQKETTRSGLSQFGTLILISNKRARALDKDSERIIEGETEKLPDFVMLAIQAMVFLCFSVICPCFFGKRKDTSEDPVLSRDMNKFHSDSVNGSKSVNGSNSHSRSKSVDGSNSHSRSNSSRVPPSPSRFSMISQSSKSGPLNLSLSQITKLTHNYSSSLKIGEGHFGSVYRAELADGRAVAIKRAKKQYLSNSRAEFRNEVALLTKIEHKNLVQLLGYIDEGNERIIISEYVPNGTLREHLDGNRGKTLDFGQRLEIAIDVAHGLTYLHLYAEKPIIHRDVKSSNILLTESLYAKVADFGFARVGPTEPDQSQIETDVRGTAGYLDPEYLKSNHLTIKSDVFSFGILLIEILTARRPVELKRSFNERITLRWAFDKYNKGQVREIIDPMLREEIDEEVLNKFLTLAFRCAAPTRVDRPVMKEVVVELWKIRKEYARNRRRV